jgi:hypothetical protein
VVAQIHSMLGDHGNYGLGGRSLRGKLEGLTKLLVYVGLHLHPVTLASFFRLTRIVRQLDPHRIV